MGTVVVGIIVAAVIFAAGRSVWKSRKTGGCDGCDGACSKCGHCREK